VLLYIYRIAQENYLGYETMWAANIIERG